MKKSKILIVGLIGLLLASCAGLSGPTNNKLSRIEIGMTTAQVIDIMGTPDARYASGNTETWNYDRHWDGARARVTFTDGLVSSFSGVF